MAKYHKITGNETIGSIAAMYGVDPQTLLKANPGMPKLYSGAALRIPQALTPGNYLGGGTSANLLQRTSRLMNLSKTMSFGQAVKTSFTDQSFESPVVQPGGFNNPFGKVQPSLRPATQWGQAGAGMTQNTVQGPAFLGYGRGVKDVGFVGGKSTATPAIPSIRDSNRPPVVNPPPLMGGIPAWSLSAEMMALITQDPIEAAQNGYVQQTNGNFVWVGVENGQWWAANKATKTQQTGTAPAKGQPGYGQSKNKRTGRTRDLRPGRARMEAASQETATASVSAPTPVDQKASNFGTSNSIWRIV